MEIKDEEQRYDCPKATNADQIDIFWSGSATTKVELGYFPVKSRFSHPYLSQIL